MHATAVANCLSSDLLSPRVMLGLTSPTIKYPNFRACQLPSSLIPQVLLKRKETLRSPSNICSPVRRPVFSCFTCLSWPTSGLPPRQRGFSAQGGHMAEPVIPCRGGCTMHPSPCAPGWSSSPCLQVTRHWAQTHHSSGRDTFSSHLKGEQKKASGKPQRIYTFTSFRMWGWLLTRRILLSSESVLKK